MRQRFGLVALHRDADPALVALDLGHQGSTRPSAAVRKPGQVADAKARLQAASLGGFARYRS
jgi:hypothetical protein